MSFHGARLKFDRFRHQAYGNRGSNPVNMPVFGGPPPLSQPQNQEQPQMLSQPRPRTPAGYQPPAPGTRYAPDTRDTYAAPGVRNVRPAYRNLPSQPTLTPKAGFGPSMAGGPMTYGPSETAAARYEQMADAQSARIGAAKDAVAARRAQQVNDPVATVDAARAVRAAALAKDGITDLGGGAKSMTNQHGTGFAGTSPATGPGRIYDNGKLVDMAASRAANSIIHTDTPAPTSEEMRQNIASETAKLQQGAPERLAQDRKQEIDAYRINTSAERAGMVRQQSDLREKARAEAELRALPNSVQAIMAAARVPTDGTSMAAPTTSPQGTPAGPIGTGTVLAKPGAPAALASSSPANTTAAAAVANAGQSTQPGAAVINSIGPGTGPSAPDASADDAAPASPAATTAAAAVGNAVKKGLSATPVFGAPARRLPGTAPAMGSKLPLAATDRRTQPTNYAQRQF